MTKHLTEIPVQSLQYPVPDRNPAMNAMLRFDIRIQDQRLAEDSSEGLGVGILNLYAIFYNLYTIIKISFRRLKVEQHNTVISPDVAIISI